MPFQNPADSSWVDHSSQCNSPRMVHITCLRGSHVLLGESLSIWFRTLNQSECSDLIGVGGDHEVIVYDDYCCFRRMAYCFSDSSLLSLMCHMNREAATLSTNFDVKVRFEIGRYELNTPGSSVLCLRDGRTVACFCEMCSTPDVRITHATQKRNENSQRLLRQPGGYWILDTVFRGGGWCLADQLRYFISYVWREVTQPWHHAW